MSLKTTIGIFLLICLGTNVPAQAQKSPDPQEAGMKVYNLLKKFDKLSAEKFARQMMSIQDFHSLVDEYNITDEQEIQRITSMTKKRWQEMAVNNYKGLEWFNEGNDIVWKNIEYGQYNYEPVENDGLTFYKGLLEFSYLQKEYSLEITSIRVGKNIEIVGIHVPAPDLH